MVDYLSIDNFPFDAIAKKEGDLIQNITEYVYSFGKVILFEKLFVDNIAEGKTSSEVNAGVYDVMTKIVADLDPIIQEVISAYRKLGLLKGKVYWDHVDGLSLLSKKLDTINDDIAKELKEN